MTDDPLPPDHHVARFCARKFISEDNRVDAGAFMLRESEEYLSVQWLEYLEKQNRQEEIIEVRKILSRHLSIRPPSKIAVLNVGRTCAHISHNSSWNISIIHKPEHDNLAHGGVYGVDKDQELLAELIKQTIEELHTAV